MAHEMRSEEKGERPRSLRTYLRDHTTGAENALQLLNAVGEQHAGTLLGTFAIKQSKEVEEDLRMLESLATRAGAEGFHVKEIAGWIGDKLSRLKLAPLEAHSARSRLWSSSAWEYLASAPFGGP
jgi:hypothetical protein